MLDPLSRRALLGLIGPGALGLAVAGSRVVDAGAPATRGLTPFALADVRLLDGPFKEAQARDLRYMRMLEPDRMLHNFRVNAGLAPKAPVYGGWESQEPWVEIRCHGHTLGHYLSAAAMMYASTGDAEMKRRVDYIVGELRACQAAAKSGLVCAFPDGSTPLDDAVAGRKIPGVPWYTQHKIFAGLRDAHVHAGSAEALRALVALTDWTAAATRAMSDAQMQKMLGVEHGGMTEVLADVSVLAGEPAYLALARRFAHRAVLEPLAAGRDTLDGLHANTQVPKFIGFERVHALDRDPAFGDAARHFWEAVATRRSYATGGHGDREHFFPVGEFASRLGSAKTMETCGTHNMLRLTRALFVADPRPAYADFYERALFNAILGSQDPDSGMTTYFQATRPGYVKLYHTPVDSFWCCTGSGLENHAKYGDSIYFHEGADALYVNLFVASVVEWREAGLSVTQTTRFPAAGATRLAIAARRPVRATIHVRHPGWCTRATVRVNGREAAASGTPGSYVALTRTWRAGDTVDVQLPMTLRVEALPGAPDTVALLYGPIALAGVFGREGIAPGADIIRNERESGSMLNDPIEVPVLAAAPAEVARHVERVGEGPLAFRTVGIGRPREARLVPYAAVAHERYTLYWKTVPA